MKKKQIILNSRPGSAFEAKLPFKRALLMLIGMSLVLSVFSSPPVMGVEFDKGELSGTLDTTVTVGGSFRVEDRDPDLVGVANGGRANSINNDNGNLNFDPGDLVSALAKVNHEVDVSWKNFGFFGRMYYFYDWAVMQIPTERTDLSEPAKRAAGRNIKLLDAYVIGDFTVLERPITVRVGNQVLSWGESTWIQNGINVINPVDVSALRGAGAELREALLPVPMISLNANITDNLSIEAFYQFYWEKTETEAEGTFFANTDYVGPGGKQVFLGFGRAPPNGPIDNPPTPVRQQPPVGPAVFRLDDNKAKNEEQGGVALRYFATFLNDTEFGLFYIHYHSRLPLLSGFTGDAPPTGRDADIFVLQTALFSLGLLDEVPFDYASTGGFIREYPEDIDVVGASFNTSLDALGMAIQGEFSYRMGQPLQVDDVELLFAAQALMDPLMHRLLPLKNMIPPPGPIFGRSQVWEIFGPFGPNQYVRGWVRKDVIQPQVTLTKVFGPALGWDQFVMLCELGATYILDMYTDRDAQGNPMRFEKAGTFTSGNAFFSQDLDADPNEYKSIQPGPPETQFATDISWGYRLAARATFNNAIGPINLLPAVAFAHDVQGTTPAPIVNFIEDRMAITASLTLDYLNQFKGKISYTNYFGGGRYNQIHDRDFASVAASYSF